MIYTHLFTYAVAFPLLSAMSCKPQELLKSYAIMLKTDSVKNWILNSNIQPEPSVDAIADSFAGT